MKRDLYKNGKKSTQKVSMPEQFNENYRPNLIKRAVLAVQSKSFQSQGVDPRAGFRKSTFLSKRRNSYKGTYGSGRSRTPRKVMWSRGTRFGFEGGFAPMTKGGRVAHPPESRKVTAKKINKRERQLAIRSALSATTIKELVEKRGHRIKIETPFVVDDSFEKLSKAKDVVKYLEKLGLSEELERVSEKKIRAGKGKSRGRKYRKKVGPLLVISKYSNISKAAKSIPGVEAITVSRLNAELLAPGTHAGRLCIFTQGALDRISKEALFGGAK